MNEINAGFSKDSIDMFTVIAEVFSFWLISVEIWLIYSFWQ